MTPDLRRTGAISAGLHAVLLLALLLTLPPSIPPAPDQTAVTMEFAPAPGEVQRAAKPAPNPAPAAAQVPTPDLPSLEPPKPVPTEAPAPPPPPPLPSPPAPDAAPLPLPPIPPPPQAAPAAPLSVAPVPTPTPTPVPTQATEAPLPLPPMPPPPTPSPAKPVATAAPTPAKPAPTPPAARSAPERPTPTQHSTSTTNQPNPTKNTAENSRALDATLERLRSLQAQTQPPTRAYNPPAGGAPGGGSPNGVDNAKLSGADRGAIGDRIRECYSQDTGGRDYAQQWAVILVTTDGTGVARQADIKSHSPGAVGQTFAERARRATLDPQCARLPLPPQLLGQNRTFEINFKP